MFRNQITYQFASKLFLPRVWLNGAYLSLGAVKTYKEACKAVREATG